MKERLMVQYWNAVRVLPWVIWDTLGRNVCMILIVGGILVLVFWWIAGRITG